MTHPDIDLLVRYKRVELYKILQVLVKNHDCGASSPLRITSNVPKDIIGDIYHFLHHRSCIEYIKTL